MENGEMQAAEYGTARDDECRSNGCMHGGIMKRSELD